MLIKNSRIESTMVHLRGIEESVKLSRISSHTLITLVCDYGALRDGELREVLAKADRLGLLRGRIRAASNLELAGLPRLP
jgi:hypothetical protein